MLYTIAALHRKSIAIAQVKMPYTKELEMILLLIIKLPKTLTKKNTPLGSP